MFSSVVLINFFVLSVTALCNIGLQSTPCSTQTSNPCPSRILSAIQPCSQSTPAGGVDSGLIGSRVPGIIARGKRIGTKIAGTLSAPYIIIGSSISAGASTLPAIFSAIGASIGAAIGTPIAFFATQGSALASAATGYLIGIPVGIGTGLVAKVVAIQELGSHTIQWATQKLKSAHSSMPRYSVDVTLKVRKIEQPRPTVCCSPPQVITCCPQAIPIFVCNQPQAIMPAIEPVVPVVPVPPVEPVVPPKIEPECQYAGAAENYGYTVEPVNPDVKLNDSYLIVLEPESETGPVIPTTTASTVAPESPSVVEVPTEAPVEPMIEPVDEPVLEPVPEPMSAPVDEPVDEPLTFQ